MALQRLYSYKKAAGSQQVSIKILQNTPNLQSWERGNEERMKKNPFKITSFI